MALASILARHRGPYTFTVYRPGKRAGFSRSEHLPELVEPEDVAARAIELIADPADTIEGVSVWSESENLFVTSINKAEDL